MKDTQWPIPPSTLETPRFFTASVRPLLSETGGPDARAAQILAPSRIVMSCRKRVVAETRLGNGERLFTKLYLDPSSGESSYLTQRALFREGFGARSHLRVPEPLGYLHREQVLVMRAAEGHTLKDLIDASRPGIEEGVEAAGRWLARLHSHPWRNGAPVRPAELLEGIRERQARAAAANPRAAPVLGALVAELERRAAAMPADLPLAQTHGDFIPAHVYLAPGAATVIDFDLSRPADPAVDVGRFLHCLRADIRRAGITAPTGDAAVARFLGAYRRASPGADLSGLAFQWSYSVMRRLLKVARKADGDPERAKLLANYQEEFHAIPRRVEALLAKTAPAGHVLVPA